MSIDISTLPAEAWVYLQQKSSFEFVLASLVVVIFGLFVLAFIEAISPKSPKTKKHREMFADLYVIGTIRKLAVEDGIDFEKELLELKKINKIERARLHSIDKVIENELKEQIQAKNEKLVK